MVNPVGKAGGLQVCVLQHGPALAPQFQRVLVLLGSPAAARFFTTSRSSIFWTIASEILVRISVDFIDQSLGIHQVQVRLIAAFQLGLGSMDGKCVGMLAANFLINKFVDKCQPLRGI